MSKGFGITFLLLLAVTAYLCFWPVSIEPVSWQAPESPGFEGQYALNDILSAAERLGEGVGVGPEDVAISWQGHAAVGYRDGRIEVFKPDGSSRTLANTGGRPLGLDFTPDGTLIVADARKGLLSVSEKGEIEVLSTVSDSLPFRFVDDVDVAPDGSVYFSDASSKFDITHHALDDVMEHGGHGRLLRYEPQTGKTETLLEGLQFANGVAVGPGEDFVLINETGSYRVMRFWLNGPLAGTTDVFIDALPGFPDGISFNGRDTFWLAIFAPRNSLLDKTADKPFLRKLIWRLPEFLKPGTVRHATVLGLDLDGNVIHNFQHKGGKSYSPVTSAEEANGYLYLGSLSQPAFARLKMAE